MSWLHVDVSNQLEISREFFSPTIIKNALNSQHFTRKLCVVTDKKKFSFYFTKWLSNYFKGDNRKIAYGIDQRCEPCVGHKVFPLNFSHFQSLQIRDIKIVKEIASHWLAINKLINGFLREKVHKQKSKHSQSH